MAELKQNIIVDLDPETKELLRNISDKLDSKLSPSIFSRVMSVPMVMWKARLAIILLTLSVGYFGLDTSSLADGWLKTVKQVDSYDADSNTLVVNERGQLTKYFLENGSWFDENYDKVSDDYLADVVESINKGKPFPKENWIW